MGTAAEAERKATAGRLHEDDLMRALPARSTNREVKVGIFVLVGLVAFLTILFTMTDVGTFRGRYYVNTVVESAGGMRRGDPVQMRGVNIGRVTDFLMVPDGVNLKMEVYDEYPIPADSHVEVKSSGLLGGMVVDVVPGDSEEVIADEGVLRGGTEAGIFAQAEGIGSRADTALMRVNMLLSENTIRAVGASADQMEEMLVEFTAMANQLRAQTAVLTASLQRSATGLEAATTGPELQRSVQNVEALTVQLNQTAQTLGQASTSLQTFTQRLDNEDSTLGRLTSTDELHENLNTTLTNLNALITDIQANPRKYINLEVF